MADIRSKFKDAQKRSEQVMVESIGAEVEARSLTLGTVSRVREIETGKAKDKEVRILKLLVVKGIYDPDTGERVWSDKDMDELDDLEWQEVQEMGEAVAHVSGMGRRGLSDAKNGSAGAGEPSTGSPAK